MCNLVRAIHHGENVTVVRLRKRSILGRALAASLSIAIGTAEPYLDDSQWEQAEAELQDAERDRAWLLESILASRRDLAHERLEEVPQMLQSQVSCPAFSNSSSNLKTFGKRITGPLTPRFAPTPAAETPWRGVASTGESPSSIFDSYISGAIVQSRCIYCHVEGGASGHTRLVLTPSTSDGHAATNLAVFQSFLENVADGADLILNKIQGAESHGGGVQVPAGSTDFANMERFLRALGAEVTSVSPATLFDGVTMASPAKTLRRAALLFAGRLPTQAEINAVNFGGMPALRQRIRALMTGPGFHEFLVRAANDRLLTDRDRGNVIGANEVKFVDFANKRRELAEVGLAKGYNPPRRYPGYQHYNRAVQYGMARAPLELIARVVENELPYTEILTADYIMANPMTAEAYGATTVFDDPNDPTEFKPSKIVTYFRRNNTMVVEDHPTLGRKVINPGNLSTEYPHAGILNTTVFLKRYPTTATNRNRARSRWTYYHFLAFDIEKSAARTTNPVALADTNNPTMNNPACTVCHIPMDPVAGTYQNYGDMGLYRDRNGGRDALPNLYRSPKDGTVSPYQRGDTWFRDMRVPGFNSQIAPSADNSLQWLAEQMVADERFAKAAVHFWWPAVMGTELVEPPSDSSDADFDELLLASGAQALEVDRLAKSFRVGFRGGAPYNAKDLLVEIALSPWFRAESVTGGDALKTAALRDAGVARLLTPEELAAKTGAVAGYVWGRRFQRPWDRGEIRSKLSDPQGFGGTSGYQLLYGGIDSDGIIERTGEITPLMASVAQSHAAEVSCPIVRREFYYWPDGSRTLFNGISEFDTPYSETRGDFEITSETWETRQSVTLAVPLSPGSKTVRLSYTNDFRGEQPADGGSRPDRNLSLDRLVVTNSVGTTVSEVELETLGRKNCGRPAGEFYRMTSNCSLDVPVDIALPGDYTVLVIAHQDRAGDEDAHLVVDVESEDGRSQGAMAIRRKLAELHYRLYGVTVSPNSADVNEAFDLFVEVWNRKRNSEGPGFDSSRFNCTDYGDHLYFEGLVPDVIRYNDNGATQLDSDRIREFNRSVSRADPKHTVRTWVVTLAYLLTDYRYLYF